MPIGIAAIAAAAELARLGIGAFQTAKGNKLGQTERPVMEISPYDTEALNISRMMAASGNMPGFNLAKENIDTTFSGAIQQGLASGNPNVSQLYANKTNALKDLAISNSGFQRDQISNLTSNLRNMGGLDRQVFDYNEAQPYTETIAAAQRLKEGGTQNIFNAISNISGAAIDTASTDEILKLLGGQEEGVGNISSLSGAIPSIGTDPTQEGNYSKLFAAIEKNPELLKMFEKYLGKD